jgi:hypothetical protein
VVDTPEGVKTYAAGAAGVNYTLAHGAWMGIIGKGLGNACLFFNRGPEMTVACGGQINFQAKVEGVQFKPGDNYSNEVAAFGFPLDVPVHTAEELQKYVAYLAQPEGLEIRQGKRVDSPGILEVQPFNNAVELSLPKPAQKLSLTVPVLVRGLNPRWSVELWQKTGYSKGFYGPGENRYRPVGLDFAGNAYVPLYPDLAETTHVMVGHPIVAGAAGKELFLQVTRVGDKPDRWHVSVNNPTDQPVAVTLHQAMDLPGLSFPDRKVTLGAGEYVVVQ